MSISSPAGMISFIKREMVFTIALCAAVVSAFFNPPSVQWVDAIDFRTLGMLFSLMAVSEGLKASGFFDSIAGVMVRRTTSSTTLSFLLIAIVFVSSMFFTNDVALLMFVPFTIMLLDRAGCSERYQIRVIVLETISANLGSMTTPVGNPQNIFICSHFNVQAGGFFSTILPYSVLSAIMVALASRLLLSKGAELDGGQEGINGALDKRRTALYLALLATAMLSVFSLISWKVLFTVVFLILIIFDRTVLKRIDYILLLTFICFFIFSGNIRNIDAVASLIPTAMGNHPVAVPAMVSQVISNVPAAILLSPFTEDFTEVLIGTNIGGLGTPIASLASLISMKLYFKKETANKGGFVTTFLVLNFLFLAILLTASLIF